MTAINQVGNALTGITGTGTFVGANTPTLITPVIGAATATSINFGGSSLSSYVGRTAFTPSFVFATLGDLSVAYSNRSCSYIKIGDLVYISFYISGTPTYTTATGQAYFTGLPFSVNASDFPVAFAALACASYPATAIYSYAFANLTNLLIYGGSAALSTQGVAFTSANFPSGVAFAFLCTITYPV